MNGLSYERLERITKTQKPYRGTTNRFPVGNRRHNTKNFYVREENGVKVFDVVYGTRFESRDITKEEFDEKRAQKHNNVHHYPHDNTYMEYENVLNVLGTTYPEEYFQFTGKGGYYTYGQGVRSFLSDCTHGWFVNDSRRGGIIWTSGRGVDYQVIPIFKGARFSTWDTPHLLDDYVVIGKKVNRKVGKELLSAYESFFKTAEVMCKAIPRDSFLATAKEVIDENKDKYFEAAEALRDQAPLDAMILYAVSMDVGRIQQQIMHPNWYEAEPHEIFTNLKRKMNNRIYREHPEVFTPVRYGKGESYPPSIWGYDIEVNGETVQQY